MNKLLQILRLACVFGWVAVLVIVLLKPGIDCTVLFIVAVAALILQNLAEYFVGRDKDAGQTKGSNY